MEAIVVSSPRDFDKSPYTGDEARVARFFFEKGTGGGDDPIGSLMASHEYLASQRNLYRAAYWRLRGDLQRIANNVDALDTETVAGIKDLLAKGGPCTGPACEAPSGH